MTRIHISLRTRDLEASRAFYSALFGAGPDKEREGYLRFQPGDAPVALTLMEGGEPSGPDHLGLKLAEVGHTKAAWQRLVDAGLAVRTEEAVNCCFAVQNKVWITDPDGRDWEVYTVTDDAPEAAASTPTACCA